MPDQKEYTGITPAGLETLRGELKSMGITPPEGDSGTVTYQGVTLGMDYSPTTETLTIRVIDKPFFIPESLIWQMLDAHIPKSAGT